MHYRACTTRTVIAIVWRDIGSRWSIAFMFRGVSKKRVDGAGGLNSLRRMTRLIPTGICFCGCARETQLGKFFVRGHDITATAALRAVEGGLSLAERLHAQGFGPERSVVSAAVDQADWHRCHTESCDYAGTRSGLAAHQQRSQHLASDDLVELPVSSASSLDEIPCQGAFEDDQPAVEDDAETEPSFPSGESLQPLRMTVHRLVTPESPHLREKSRRPLLYALRAADRGRLSDAHWKVLQAATRADLGSRRSTRADAVFAALQNLTATHQRL